MSKLISQMEYIGVPIKDTENIFGRKNLRGQKLCHCGVVIWSNSYPVQNI